MIAPLSRPAERWNAFWFRPQPTSTLALFRIAFGVLVTLWFATLAPQLGPFFGPDAAVPESRPMGPGVWTLFSVTGQSTALVVLLWLIMLAAAIALTVGFRTRVASVVVFVGLVSIGRHLPFATNTGDALIRIMSFYLMFAPAGAALSVDRRRTCRERFWDAPLRAPWALRLLQIQLSVVYFSTVWEKVQGATWRSGTAVSFALRALEVQRTPTPAFVTDSLALTQLMTFGTLALELALAILVWNRAARPWVMALGVLLHLAIEITIVVGFFSLAMLTLYLVFVPPERATRLVETVRARWVARRRRTSTSDVEASVPEPS